MTIADLGVALGLMLVIEGTLYALFPGFMRRIMTEALSLPEGQLRIAALMTALMGLAVVWIVRG